MDVGAIVLDVNETLFSLDPVRRRFEAAGLAGEDLEPWFARVLRDGFALAATGTAAPFPELAAFHLRGSLQARGLVPDGPTVAHVLAGFEEVEPHPDVAEGLAAAADAGLTVATLTNGTAAITRDFLRRAGLASYVDVTLESIESGVWKPHPEAYRWASRRLGTQVGRLLLVAVHPWDVHGALNAGLRAAWLDRDGAPYPAHFREPDLRAATLAQVVAGMEGAGRSNG